MVDCFSSKESVLIRFQLAVELVVLIGKMFPCRGKLCRIEAGLTRNFAPYRKKVKKEILSARAFIWIDKPL
jgi:hypothetical protein